MKAKRRQTLIDLCILLSIILTLIIAGIFVLVSSYEGVEKLYTVSLGDQYIGTVSNLRELYLIKNEYLPVWSPETKLTIREIYTYAGAETPQEEVRNAFRQLSLPNLPV